MLEYILLYFNYTYVIYWFDWYEEALTQRKFYEILTVA